MLTQKKTHLQGNLTCVKKAALPGQHSVENFGPCGQTPKRKNIQRVLAGTPASRESGNIVVFCFLGFFVFCFLKVFGLPRSKSLQILPCLLPGSGDPNDHAYGSAVYVVKPRPIASEKNMKSCTPRSWGSVYSKVCGA